MTAIWAMPETIYDVDDGHLAPSPILEKAKAAGVDTISIMIDERSKDRSYRPYRRHDVRAWLDARDVCEAAGFDVGLTVWAQPDTLDAVRWLTDQLRPDHLCLDAEEPWTKSGGVRDPEAWAKAFDDTDLPVYVSTILYATPRARALVDAFGPESWVPQVYSPRLALDPERLERRIECTDHVALPLYHSRPELAALQHVTAATPNRWYWSLRHFGGEKL